jgi:hypothetical protein
MDSNSIAEAVEQLPTVVILQHPSGSQVRYSLGFNTSKALFK